MTLIHFKGDWRKQQWPHASPEVQVYSQLVSKQPFMPANDVSNWLSCRSWRTASHLCFRSFSATGSSSGVSSGSAPLSSYLGFAAFFGCSRWHRNNAHSHRVHCGFLMCDYTVH